MTIEKKLSGRRERGKKGRNQAYPSDTPVASPRTNLVSEKVLCGASTHQRKERGGSSSKKGNGPVFEGKAERRSIGSEKKLAKVNREAQERSMVRNYELRRCTLGFLIAEISSGREAKKCKGGGHGARKKLGAESPREEGSHELLPWRGHRNNRNLLAKTRTPSKAMAMLAKLISQREKRLGQIEGRGRTSRERA